MPPSAAGRNANRRHAHIRWTTCIRVVGHSDARGTAEYNNKLSAQRAAAAVDHLTARFDRARFQVVGAGADGTAGDVAANRRTDFQIIANDRVGGSPRQVARHLHICR
jgi:flagellar motor protein MotB